MWYASIEATDSHVIVHGAIWLLLIEVYATEGNLFNNNTEYVRRNFTAQSLTQIKFK